MLSSNFPLVIYFTHGNAYISMLLSQFVLPSPYPNVVPGGLNFVVVVVVIYLFPTAH